MIPIKYPDSVPFGRQDIGTEPVGHDDRGSSGNRRHTFIRRGLWFFGYRTGNTVRYDGMITANKWKHHGTAPEKAYNYSYDIPKRLTQSTYKQKKHWQHDMVCQ